MKFKAWYSVEYESEEGWEECEADSEEEAREIIEEMIRDEVTSFPDIASISVELERVYEDEEPPEPKFIDPNQIDWVEQRT